MGLSSNALIHFTSSKEALKGILAESFRMKYCCESIALAGRRLKVHIPMVSFCDIPLSQVKDHIASYGRYGIGLSKEWAIRNRLNPILYVESSSALAKTYDDLMSTLYERENAGVLAKDVRELGKDLARYIKNYEGELVRKGRAPVPKYRFSDEREWRYVPERSSADPMWHHDSLFDRATKEKANKSISSLRLDFSPDDIKYIIIDNDSEISEFVHHLQSASGHRFSYAQVVRLTTRILTSEQIHSDI